MLACLPPLGMTAGSECGFNAHPPPTITTDFTHLDGQIQSRPATQLLPQIGGDPIQCRAMLEQARSEQPSEVVAIYKTHHIGRDIALWRKGADLKHGMIGRVHFWVAALHRLGTTALIRSKQISSIM